MSEEQPQQNRELPDLFKELGQPFPDDAYKKVTYGKREFITLDAYHIVERLTRIAGSCSVGWGWKDLIFTPYPDSVSCHGIFWIKDPHTGITLEIPAVGDGAIIKGSSAAEAAKKAQTNMMSKAVSFIGVGTVDLYQGKMLDCPLTDRSQNNGTSVPAVPVPSLVPTASPSAEVDLTTGSVPQGPETPDKPSCPQCGQVGTVRPSNYGGYWCNEKDCPNTSFGPGANTRQGGDKAPAAATGKKDYSNERKYWQVLDECVETANCEKDMMDSYLVEAGMMTGSMEKWMEMQGHHKDYITAEEETFKKGFFGWLGAVTG